MTIEFRSAAAAALILALAGVTGCGGDDDEGGGSGDATNAATDGNDSGQTEGNDSMTSGQTSATTATTAADSGSDPLPDGSECSNNADCISEKCFVVSILGGICGECLGDDDCPDGGCSIPNPLADPPKGATCNNGELAGGCESTEVCQEGLVCALILDASSVGFTASTCSECLADSDCSDGRLCSPSYDIPNLSGARVCVDPGSVPNGQGCDHETSGDDACSSGFCYEYDFEGILTIGVCGECKTNADCAEGECQEPSVNTDTLEVTPPQCG